MATKASYVSNFQGFTRKAARHRIYDYPHIKFDRGCVRAVSFSSLPVISVRAAHGDGGETLEAKGQIFDVAAADSTAAPPICKAGAD